HKLSSKEGEKMVYKWLAEQQRQLESMRKRLKSEVLKTKLYSSKDLAKLNSAIKRLSKEISRLQSKKKKAEKARKKVRKKNKPKRKKKSKR
ncbi:MAG: hypothetical protein JW744_04810, partial [Candidatus Diapherotrites archaeon]|nr:hypothetical protein [Candidatus Diapherotrites archaeon]